MSPSLPHANEFEPCKDLLRHDPCLARYKIPLDDEPCPNACRRPPLPSGACAAPCFTCRPLPDRLCAQARRSCQHTPEPSPARVVLGHDVVVTARPFRHRCQPAKTARNTARKTLQDGVRQSRRAAAATSPRCACLRQRSIPKLAARRCSRRSIRLLSNYPRPDRRSMQRNPRQRSMRVQRALTCWARLIAGRHFARQRVRLQWLGRLRVTAPHGHRPSARFAHRASKTDPNLSRALKPEAATSCSSATRPVNQSASMSSKALLHSPRRQGRSRGQSVSWYWRDKYSSAPRAMKRATIGELRPPNPRPFSCSLLGARFLVMDEVLFDALAQCHHLGAYSASRRSLGLQFHAGTGIGLLPRPPGPRRR